MHIPGLKVYAAQTPYDAKGLLKTAIRDDNPVLFFDETSLWGRTGPVPEEDYTVPEGEAVVRREGSDITIVAVFTLKEALEAADRLTQDGILAEVVDPRTLKPLDEETILRSVAKTGRLVVSDMAWRTCSAASEIAAMVVERGFRSLKAPIRRVATPNVHIPYSPALEASVYPSAEKIVAAAKECMAG
jgi:pyruvate dehydrogenase E1 component beta subunit